MRISYSGHLIGSFSARQRYRRIALRLLLSQLILSATAVFTASETALASGRDPVPTLDQFYSAVHFSASPAAYVVLVDTSGSMMADGMYGQVQLYLSSFEKSLSPQDTVTYFTFSSIVSGPYLTARSLPPVATGTYTDFGPALAQGLSALSAAADKGADVGGLFLLSDGIIDAPPTDQQYLTLKSSGWLNLRASANALASRMAVTGYGLTMLPGAGTAGSGPCGGQPTTDPATCAGVQEVLTTVFGAGALVVNGSAGADFGSLLSQAKADERRSKAARQLLRNDAGQGVSFSIKPTEGSGRSGRIALVGSSVPITIRLSSHVPDLPVQVSNISIRSATNTYFHVTGLPSSVSLGPGQIKVLSARLWWHAPNAKSLFGGSHETNGVMTIGGVITSPWLAVIRADLASSFRLGEVSPGTISYSGTYAESIDVTMWLVMSIFTLIFAIIITLAFVFAFPRIAADMEAMDLRDDFVRALAIKGRRRWTGTIYGSSDKLGRLTVTGLRNGGARVHFTREVDGATRSGRRQFAHSDIAVVASVAFRSSDASN